ncbi:DegV family protein [Egicoccus halophilus]|uniref:DegV domain-containing protein n=1 Tax=Egicoccus halophilus TaxID=1670830 RepID=A0A8J3EUX7_9ACTN|nr:DegV family protein [Egicoccus halophilus]GGI06903.1 DegV domain-containing protein [Egicoccus halophilus]
MGQRVAVVTDSTCDLPVELVERLGIRVVPLSVAFGDEVLVSGVTVSDEQFYTRLATASRLPTTSQPAPVWFEEAYADCADDGHDAVVSLHVSSSLSGTVELARQRAARAGLPVEVVDTRLVGGALGLAVLRAHEVAAGGGSVAQVVAAARQASAGTCSLLVVDDLAHLKRGGRLTGAQAAVGNVLRVKPVLEVADGRVEVRERTRTWQRALDRVAERLAQRTAGRPVDVVVAHAVAPERAASVWERLEDRIEVVDRLETLMGPIVGTHVGPGAVGVAVAPRP